MVDATYHSPFGSHEMGFGPGRETGIRARVGDSPGVNQIRYSRYSYRCLALIAGLLPRDSTRNVLELASKDFPTSPSLKDYCI